MFRAAELPRRNGAYDHDKVTSTIGIVEDHARTECRLNAVGLQDKGNSFFLFPVVRSLCKSTTSDRPSIVVEERMIRKGR